MSIDDPSRGEVSVYCGLEAHSFGHPKVDVCGRGDLLRIFPTGPGGLLLSLSPDAWGVIVAAVEDALANYEGMA